MVTYLKPRKPLSHRHKSAAPPIPGSNRITEQRFRRPRQYQIVTEAEGDRGSTVPVHPWSQVELRRHRQAGELVGDPVTITAKMRATHTPPASRRVGGRSGDRHSKNARHAAALHSTVRPAVARRERTENRRGKYLDSRGSIGRAWCSGGAALLRRSGRGALRASTLRSWAGRRQRQAGRSRSAAERSHEGPEHRAVFQRIVAGRNDHVDLLGRQLEGSLDRVEGGGTLRIELIESDPADVNLDVAAIPSERSAIALAFSRRELAAPIDQRRLPIVHRILERRVTADSAGFGRGVGGRRNQVDAGGASTVCDQAPDGARPASTTRIACAAVSRPLRAAGARREFRRQVARW